MTIFAEANSVCACAASYSQGTQCGRWKSEQAFPHLGQRFHDLNHIRAASASLYDQVWMMGWRLTSSIPAMMRCLSSCFEVTRMWRRTERANLEKKPSMRLALIRAKRAPNYMACLFRVANTTSVMN